MWHDTNKIISEPRTVPRCFSLYYLDHSHNPSNTSCDLCPPDKGPRLVDISLVAIYFRELCLVGPSQVSRHAAVETATGMDRS